MGRLRRCLQRGEYGRLRDLPLLEGDFLQVTRGGDAATRVTVGVAASGPQLPRPDLLLLAAPAPGPPHELQLCALVPLGCVALSLRSAGRGELRVRLPSGRCLYLRLLGPPPRLPRLFLPWLRLLLLLRAPPRDPPGEEGGTPGAPPP